MAKRMSPFRYKHEIPPEYRCDTCDAGAVRLWRDYQTFAESTRLLCQSCAERDQGKPISPNSDQIGWMVPAVPTEDGYTFWGYTSVPLAGVDWWKSLS
jgi:hypothetical protein